MPSTLNPAPVAYPLTTGDQAAHTIPSGGTGTTNDGKHLPDVVGVDAVTMQPVSFHPGSLSSGQQAVGTAATLIRPAAGSPRVVLTVRNISTQVMWIGGANVSANNGYVLYPGETYDTRYGGAVYGVVASGSGMSCYWEETY